MSGRQRAIASTEMATDPIIIFGSPRSGTSYLRAVLSEHPEVFISQETKVFTWARQAIEVDVRDKRYFLNNRRIFESKLAPWARELILDFYRTLGKGKFYWGDKNPHYCANQWQLKLITRLFEGTRFLHIIRDPRDVVASLVSKGWVDVEQAHQVWIKHVETGSEFGASLPEGQYYEVRYEELFNDGEGVTEGIFDFLNIPMADEVRDYCEQQAAERTPLSHPTRDQSLLGAGGSQWETLLDAGQRRKSLELLAPHLERWGYAAESVS
jgi:hypothetical protein